MKKIAFCAATLLSMSAFSQNTNTFPLTGTAGIGTITPSTIFNAQIHGTTDYSFTFPSQPAIYRIDGTIAVPAQAGYTTNYGKTSRLGFTNTTSGATGTDGSIIRQSGLDFAIDNLEKKLITFQSNLAVLRVDGTYNRVNVGLGVHTSADFAGFNVNSQSDNGVNIETVKAGKYGLKVKVNADTDYAAKFFGSNAAVETFSVKGNGSTTINYNVATNSDKVFEVKNASQTLMQVTNEGILRSRGMKVNTQTWADYVFEKDYQLRSLDEVKAYIHVNGHLPEVPSTAEVTENGVDVAEMNEILLKKIEELTLYLLQQDAKIKSLENSIETLTNK